MTTVRTYTFNEITPEVLERLYRPPTTIDDSDSDDEDDDYDGPGSSTLHRLHTDHQNFLATLPPPSTSNKK